MYLYAIIDVYSRYIVGWRLSNTLDRSNCTDLLEECTGRHGAPETVNTDQGCQYTSKDWIGTLGKHRIRASMDGRGRCKGQHLDRALLAHHQAGICLRLSGGLRGGASLRDRKVHRVLQREKASSESVELHRSMTLRQSALFNVEKRSTIIVRKRT